MAGTDGAELTVATALLSPPRWPGAALRNLRLCFPARLAVPNAMFCPLLWAAGPRPASPSREVPHSAHTDGWSRLPGVLSHSHFHLVQPPRPWWVQTPTPQDFFPPPFLGGARVFWITPHAPPATGSRSRERCCRFAFTESLKLSKRSLRLPNALRRPSTWPRGSA